MSLTPHAALKAATCGAHDLLDTHFSTFDLSDVDDYGRFLAAHAAAFVPVEAALDAAGAERFVPDWTEHCRSASIEADLADLGVPMPNPVEAPSFENDPALLGGLYVIEGSRLGGAFLNRTVGERLPRRFLSGSQGPGHWRRLIATLNQFLYAEASLHRAASSALETFACFEVAITVTRR